MHGGHNMNYTFYPEAISTDPAYYAQTPRAPPPQLYRFDNQRRRNQLTGYNVYYVEPPAAEAPKKQQAPAAKQFEPLPYDPRRNRLTSPRVYYVDPPSPTDLQSPDEYYMAQQCRGALACSGCKKILTPCEHGCRHIYTREQGGLCGACFSYGNTANSPVPTAPGLDC